LLIVSIMCAFTNATMDYQCNSTTAKICTKLVQNDPTTRMMAHMVGTIGCIHEVAGLIPYANIACIVGLFVFLFLCPNRESYGM